MAQGTFVYPAIPPNLQSGLTGGPFTLGMDIIPAIGGLRITDIYYFKDPADIATHTATVYIWSSQVALGSQNFTGESPSGWQTLHLTTPISLTASVEYIVAVTTGATINKFTSWGGVTTPAMTTSQYGYYTVGVGFPATPQIGSYFGIDVLVDGLPSPARRHRVSVQVP